MTDGRVPGTLLFRFDGLDGWYTQLSWGCAGAAGTGGRRSIDNRPTQIRIDLFDSAARDGLGFGRDHPWDDEPIKFGGTELAQVAPDVAVDRLGPQRLRRSTVP